DGLRVARDEPEVRGRELPPQWAAAGVAQRLELLEMGELAHVDLGGEVAADRALERLVVRQLTAGQRPAAGARVESALPEEHAEAPVTHLEDDGEHDVCGSGCFRPGVVNHVDSGQVIDFEEKTSYGHRRRGSRGPVRGARGGRRDG